jgi:tetratricopeptide (TPR) repeat protein
MSHREKRRDGMASDFGKPGIAFYWNSATEQVVITSLEQPDLFHFNCASGWLDLGNLEEAEAELARIAPDQADHPEVLLLRWEIYASQRDWERALSAAQSVHQISPERSDGWIKEAFALHELQRTEEAYECLLPASKHFPDVSIISYNLACYTCKMDREKEALNWLLKAFKQGGKESMKKMALEDSDLAPIRDQIKKL